MKTSEQTLSILNELGELNFKEDFASLLESCTIQNKITDFGDIAFNSKFICKTKLLLNRLGEGDDTLKLQNEFKIIFDKLLLQLNDILNLVEEHEKYEFQKKFLDISPESFKNLNLLIEDFAKYKNYLIDKKS